MTHIYRLDEAGKICSGDYLSVTDKLDPSITISYLIETGRLFYAYMIGIWVILGASCIFGVLIIHQILTVFS